MTTGAEPAPPATPDATGLFGDRLPQAWRYGQLLQTVGVERGLLGPREADRVWSRHILNCAAAAPLIPPNADVADLGAGAGLPGIPLALARPDLTMTLIEPMRRRVAFLAEVVTELGLSISVVQARAEQVQSTFAVVVARAVAPLDRLLTLAVPLLRGPGSQVLAFKGRAAEDEVEAAAGMLSALRAEATVVDVGSGAASARVVVVRLTRAPGRRRLPSERGREVRRSA